MEKEKIHISEDGSIMFQCPGCGCNHSINTSWTWNNDKVKPTFSPSILVKSGHFMGAHKENESCWCTFNKEHPDDLAPYKCSICHSFVNDGKIQFLNDCTHELKGKTVDMIDWNEY